jgi:hypothetical protein
MIAIRRRISLSSVRITIARTTILVQRIAEIARLASLTTVSECVEQTVFALASQLVTAGAIVWYGVAIALTQLARTTSFFRVAIIVYVTLVAIVSTVSFFALTDKRVAAWIQITRFGKLISV